MQLNLPVFDLLSACRNLLIAGMGGGFDLFCGLPIYFELQRRGQPCHLASFSFSSISRLRDGVRLTPTLVGVTADNRGPAVYFPELYLAQWFREKRGEEVTITKMPCSPFTRGRFSRPASSTPRSSRPHRAISGISI